ncbi:ApbE superfamily uncharacterized protein (UPF0280 family) [Bradyrhizobium sp. GM2.2]|uniref:hypothetical protein n=1 Tax=Bradyrhizobium sp. GM2.2 TaxID=3156358 RepID=UPI0033914218
MTAYALATRGGNIVAHARPHGAIGLFAGTMSVFGYLAFPLGPVVALRETSAIFGALIGTFILSEAFGVGRITASTFVISGIAVLALNH